MLVRTKARDQLYASVIEPHGYFNEAQERSEQARPAVQSVRILSSTPEASVVEITAAKSVKWVVMVNNGPASATARHRVTADGQVFEWTGNYRIEGIVPR